VPVPPADKRGPDYALPLKPEDVDKFLVLASGGGPQDGRIERWEPADWADARRSVNPEVDRHFKLILDELTSVRFGDGVAGSRPSAGAGVLTTYELGAGSLGNLFDPKGATERALDARLRTAGIGDVVAGRYPGKGAVPAYLFVFYRASVLADPPLTETNPAKIPYTRFVAFPETSVGSLTESKER
jgi:hypothetical protein